MEEAYGRLDSLKRLDDGAKTEVGWLLAVYDKRARRPVSGAEYQPFVRLRVRDLSMF